MQVSRLRLGFGARIMALALVVTALGLAGLGVLRLGHLWETAMAEAARRLEASIRLLRMETEALGGAWRLEGPDRLFRGDVALNGLNTLPDHVRDITGGVATIFAGETRIATNVTRPEGGRAVGIRLAPGPALEAIPPRRGLSRQQHHPRPAPPHHL